MMGTVPCSFAPMNCKIWEVIREPKFLAVQHLSKEQTPRSGTQNSPQVHLLFIVLAEGFAWEERMVQPWRRHHLWSWQCSQISQQTRINEGLFSNAALHAVASQGLIPKPLSHPYVGRGAGQQRNHTPEVRAVGSASARLEPEPWLP